MTATSYSGSFGLKIMVRYYALSYNPALGDANVKG